MYLCDDASLRVSSSQFPLEHVWFVERKEAKVGRKRTDTIDRSFLRGKKENCRAYCVTIFLVNEKM